MNRTSSSGDRKKVRKKHSKKETSRSNSGSGGGGGVSAHDHSTTRRKSYRKGLTKNQYLEDDDFSVAPGIDQDVKSVVSISFDDVYQRGRKVRFF